jgi:hypothetical protein
MVCVSSGTSERTSMTSAEMPCSASRGLGRLERPGTISRQRDDRHVAAPAQHARLAEFVDVLAVGHLALHRIERLLLEEQHRVGVAHRRGEQALHVGGKGGRDDLEPGHRHRPVLDALRVLRAEARAAAVGRADDERKG